MQPKVFQCIGVNGEVRHLDERVSWYLSAFKKLFLMLLE